MQRRNYCVRKKIYLMAWAVIALVIGVSCSLTKHVPDGKFLLDKVEIKINDNNKDVKPSDMINYLRQTPNHEVLGGIKLQLMFYDLSGKDSSKWLNRWIQRVGSEPIIYDEALAQASVNQLKMALVNRGYMKADVTFDTLANAKKKKLKVTYNVLLNSPHYVESVSYNIPNDTLRQLILKDSVNFLIKPGSLFDRNNLDLERQQITEHLRNNGYYAFSKDYITFTADTTADSKAINLILNTMPPYKNNNIKGYTRHKPFYVRNVTFVTNFDPLVMHENGNYAAQDTVHYKGLDILYGSDHYLRPGVIDESCFIEPGMPYNASSVSKTYQAFGRLGIVKFINIEIRPVGEIDGELWVDTYVLLTKGKPQTVSLSLEGTNSEGDLGFGVGAAYQHRNLSKGSEILNAKFRASYESLSGDLSGLINDNYSEYAGEMGITFPKFKCPLLQKSFKQKILASTEFLTQFNYQERPEYTRIIAGAGWKYHWTEKQNRTRHTFNLIDVSYVYLPKSRLNFLDSISNPLLRYSYENHFIMRMGYSFYHTNKLNVSPLYSRSQINVYTIRAAIESAGNLLYGISKAVGQSHEDDAYKIFGIRYSQYMKLDADYSITHSFSPKSSLAFHVGAGVGVPYGNSTVLPFEKRFYAGGANGVRGWGVRTLGPGSFDASNSVNSFIYQCGDIRLDLNLEYRAKLFWVIEMGAFIDAGNIWTIRNYEDQPGGMFKFDEFYKQIALAYGLGIRLDFTYFLLRFDVGMKAYNPAQNQVRWPLTTPNWNRDATFHFSVGYPF